MKFRSESFDSEVEFVARHWRQDAFEPEQAMERSGLVKPAHGPGVWLRSFVGSVRTGRRMWTAAASVGMVLVAAAAGLYFGLRPSEPTAVDMPPVVVETVERESVQHSQRTEVKRIEFENASLAEVTSAIEQTYGVQLDNVPVSSAQRITISYSGTADDVVETLNEIFGLHITIEDQ